MRWIIGAAAGIALLNFVLLIAGLGVLLHQRRVDPGERYLIAEHGNVGASQQASLVCRYWNGWGVATNVIWFSPNNIMGRAACPLVVSSD